MSRRLRSERGLTLTEMMVVIVIAAVLMTGVVVFYLNSQATWLDGSTQALTQREATLVVTAIGQRAREAIGAAATPTMLTLSITQDSTYCYWWNNVGDSLVYEGQPGQGHPMCTSPAECFAVHVAGSMVYVDSLRLRSANGQRVVLGASANMINWTRP